MGTSLLVAKRSAAQAYACCIVAIPLSDALRQKHGAKDLAIVISYSGSREALSAPELQANGAKGGSLTQALIGN